ncbi:Transcriptional regulator [Frankia canadensis]|uniref:Transcriptional regulator n=1 Tax=Frankia canadensis TaxID=1836972 RepID=A0A2I2KXJ3_9ACTN|nr:TetR/AcrR family transcriptional regulator [Frankia canadensis]SNQ50382.1 Transcriptional regulator [Frankia canadensis]SOU57672.1 Transcriptional regulator [Frankia canadensis]
MSRVRSAVERRAQLMDAGAELFTTKGLAATTLDDITRRAGVSKGLFYQYFSSKEALVFALQEKFATAFATDVSAAAAERPDWPGKLDAVVLACYERFTAQEDLHDVLFRHLPGDTVGPRAAGESADLEVTGPAGHQAAHRHLVRAIGELLDAGIAAGAYRVADVEATALLFFTAMHAFDRAFRHDYGLTDDRLIQATQRLVRGAAGIPEPAGAVQAVSGL